MNRLLADRATAINAGRIEPRRESPDLKSLSVPGQTSPTVPTTNPATEDLTFSAADEARDVASRLETYSRRALGEGTEVRIITVEEAFRLAQASGREYLNAEEDYILAAISVLIERHLWSPRLFNDTTVAIAGSGNEGSFNNALSVVNSLRATKRLPYGGQVEARWVWQATEQLRSSVSGQYVQSSDLILSASLPLLRGAGTAAREELIQAERNLIYSARTFENFRRQFLVDIADDYFSLLQTRARIANQERQNQSLQRSLESARARADAGRIPRFGVVTVESRLLSGIASLASLREQYILQLDRFKVRLGLDPRVPIDVADLEFELAEPEIDEFVAAERALEYRLDLQNQRDRVVDARRAVANARNNVLPDLDLNGQVGIPTDPSAREGGVGFDPDFADYSAGMTLSLPLDRRIERLGVKRATIQLEQQVRNYERTRDDVVVTARSAVRQIDRARFALTLAERQVLINRERLREQELKQDEIDPLELVDTEDELLRSENDRDAARTDLRNAILNYLLVTGQLRVTPTGEFQPLPGMMLRNEEGDAAPVPQPPVEPAPTREPAADLEDDDADGEVEGAPPPPPVERPDGAIEPAAGDGPGTDPE